jgi:hypothetical protein
VKSADQKKEFNFFANFAPSFPENASEPYASGPEIKFLVSRKTSEKRVLFSYDFHATAPDCGATSVGSTLNEWWVWETEGTLKVFGEMQKITRSLKNRSGEFPDTAARPATQAPPPVQTHRDNRPVYVVVAPASRGLHIRFEPSARSAIVATLHQRDRVFVDEGRVRNNRPPSPVDLQKVTSMMATQDGSTLITLLRKDESYSRLRSHNVDEQTMCDLELEFLSRHVPMRTWSRRT